MKILIATLLFTSTISLAHADQILSPGQIYTSQTAGEQIACTAPKAPKKCMCKAETDYRNPEEDKVIRLYLVGETDTSKYLWQSESYEYRVGGRPYLNNIKRTEGFIQCGKLMAKELANLCE